jgi:hypothetical protein
MATAAQLIPINPVGEDSEEKRPRIGLQSKMQEYPQGLTSASPGSTRSVSAEEVLEKLMSQRESDSFNFAVDVRPFSPFAGWSRSIVAEIDALLARDEDEVAPTPYAYEKARSVVESAYAEISRGRGKKPRGVPEVFPKPLVTTDDVGGIRLSWRAGSKHLTVNFGATDQRRSYVYFETNADHGIHELQPHALAAKLGWLVTE